MRHDGLVGSQELPGLHYPVQLTVRPEDDVLEDGQGVRVEEVVVVGDDLLPSGAVVVAKVDEVKFGVREIDSLVGQVESQAVGPVDLGADDHRPLGSVHADSLQTRELAPVGPEQPPGFRRRIKAESARL